MRPRSSNLVVKMGDCYSLRTKSPRSCPERNLDWAASRGFSSKFLYALSGVSRLPPPSRSSVCIGSLVWAPSSLTQSSAIFSRVSSASFFCCSLSWMAVSRTIMALVSTGLLSFALGRSFRAICLDIVGAWNGLGRETFSTMNFLSKFLISCETPYVNVSRAYSFFT